METPADQPSTPASAPVPRVIVVVAGLVIATAVIAAAWYMTGPAPKAATVAGSTASKQFPPLVLADDVAVTSPLARAAKLLTAGSATGATSAFAKLAVAQPEAVEPQVGLILSRWRSTGPAAVIGDLSQVAKEHPDDGWVVLELGLARILNDDSTVGNADFVAARKLAQAGKRYDVVRHVDDLLHPSLVPGYPPTVVGPSDIGNPQSVALVTQIGSLLNVGDHIGAGHLAATPAATRAAVADPLVAAVVAAARYNKDRPLEADALLVAALKRAPGNDALLLQRSLVLIWSGDGTRGRRLLMQVAGHGDPSGRWRHDAELIVARLQ